MPKNQSWALTGTALGLLMASSPVGAYALQGKTLLDIERRADAAIILSIQAACAEDETPEACADRIQKQTPPEDVAPAQQPEEQPAIAPEEVPQPEVIPEAPAVEPEAPPAEVPAPAPEAPAVEPSPNATPPEAPAVEPLPEAPAVELLPEAPAVEPLPEAPAVEPLPEAPAVEPLPEVPLPLPEAPAVEPLPEVPTPQPGNAPELPAPEPMPVEPAPEAPAVQPAPEAPTVEPAPEPQGQVVEPAPAGEAQPDPNAAPLLDSQKEPPQSNSDITPLPEGEQEQPAAAPVDPGPPPVSDEAATEAAQPTNVQPVTEEQGVRVDKVPEQEDLARRERPKGFDVLRELGDRVIIQFGDNVTVESSDRPRMTRGAQDVYYEDLSRGRTRETIVRGNGDQIVTIRDRYGDVIRRSRVTPDGREYVLSYVDDEYSDERDDGRDAGYDLPPMRLTIPADEYVLAAEDAEDSDEYYDFLEQPPVERVKRLYSIDEVKRSARVRDIVRRVELDTLTFDSGSADIPQREIKKLTNLAAAMERMLAKNPAETFLIEGHTDAVGSEIDNLALSDRRAEAVAEVLTEDFLIPPENLATQGYGERYLKVKTQEADRDNRRVSFRRISPLVAPQVSAN